MKDKRVVNICFFMDGLYGGGIGRVASILMNAFVKDSRFHCFALCYSGDEYHDMYLLDKEVKTEHIFVNKESMTMAVLMHHLISRVDRYVKNNNIHVIIACGAQFYPVATIVAKHRKIKLWCWEHTNPNNKSDYRFQDESRVFGAKCSDLNIVLTKDALAIYNKRFPQKRNIQIYNPIDSNLLVKTEKYNSKAKRIISVGRLRPQKNFDRLLDVAAIVLPKYPDWAWDIYGEGPLRDCLEKKARDLLISEQVCFKGQSSDLYNLYSNYAFIVMTSDWEGFPMTLLEGAAKGLPMISFDIPTGPKEIIKDGFNGFLVNNGDIQKMADRIITLINDECLRKDLSAVSRLTAEQFDIEEIVSQWKQLLEEII